MGNVRTAQEELLYKLEYGHLTVHKKRNELSADNVEINPNYLFQDSMLEYLIETLTPKPPGKETPPKQVIQTNNNSTNIEEFAPYKDFNVLLSAWTDYNRLCSEFIDIYQSYKDNGDITITNNIMDVAALKERMKDKVVTYING